MPTGEVIAISVEGLWERVLEFFPSLLIAVIVLIAGWLTGIGLGGIVQKILEAVKIDDLANSVGLDRLSAKTGKKLSIAVFGNWLVKWFFLVATFLTAADILGLNQVGAFLYMQVIPCFANVVVAVAIMLIGTVAANFLHGVVRHSLQAGGLRTSDALALITKWAIMIFALLAALSELRVASNFVQDLFRALIAMLAIAGGIAFGLGGREHARKVLDAIEKDVEEK